MRRGRFTILVVAFASACGARTELGSVGPIDAQSDVTDAAHDSSPDVIVDVVPSIAAANGRACVVRSTGHMKCWGLPPIGNGTELAATTAIDVADHVRGVAAMNFATCALRSTGDVGCWGHSQTLQLGLGLDTSALADDAGNLPSPMSVDTLGFSNVTVSGGATAACTLGKNATVTWWGDGLSNNQNGFPAVVAGFVGTVSAIAEGDHFQCALLTSGQIQCWGNNTAGQLGIGTFSPNEPLASNVVLGIGDAIAIAAGTSHACAVHVDGTVSCWGDDTEGELGDDASMDAGPIARATPVAVDNVADALFVRAGGHNSCVVSASHAVRCWGGNSNGSLHDGTGQPQPKPVAVVGLSSDVVDIAMGRTRACALLSQGGAKCWGSGPLGDGDASTAGSKVPVDVLGLP